MLFSDLWMEKTQIYLDIVFHHFPWYFLTIHVILHHDDRQLTQIYQFFIIAMQELILSEYQQTIPKRHLLVTDEVLIRCASI